MMSKFIMKIVCYFKKHFVTRIRNFVFTYRKSIERKCPVTTMSKVSTKDAIISFEIAFNFLQQGNLEMDCKEFKPLKPLKKVKLLDNTTKYYILFQQIIFISVCIIHLFIY